MTKGCGLKFHGPTDAAARARPAGCRDLAHVSGTATARLHATVASAVGWRKVLELCGCIRFRRRSAAMPAVVCKSRSSCSDVLLLLVLLAGVAVRSTSCRRSLAGCESFMELCGCATPLLGLCGTASKLTDMDPSLAQLASWCLQHACAWLVFSG